MHIFLQNGDYCVYCPSNVFRSTRSFENWGISLGEYHSDIPQIFSQVTRINQSRASKNILLIIMLISINLQGFYHKGLSLIGYVTHYLFCVI